MVAFVLAAGAAITSLGLAMATWCPRLGRAVGLTVSLYLLLTIGWLFLIMAAYRWDHRGLMMGSPWFWSGMVTAVVGGASDDVWAAAYCWTVAHVLTALVLLAATLKTFDRCLGRVESRPRPRMDIEDSGRPSPG
jgi:hypothetical protein